MLVTQTLTSVVGVGWGLVCYWCGIVARFGTFDVLEFESNLYQLYSMVR